MAENNTALVERPARSVGEIERLTASNIKTTQDLADRIRAMQEHAFILSPMSAVGAIAPGYEINPVVVPLDPSVDPESGRGADVYHQPSIHRRRKVGDRKYEPEEVSVNAYGLGRILAAAGVNVHPTRWLQDGVKERYLWVCETDGDLIDFAGQLRLLPTGIGSLDARDGSPDIGEWTPEAWAQNVRNVEARREQTPKEDRWKVKPEPINGWTAERVMQVRKYGRQLAKTKSLNGLARKLGVRQSYTVAELRRKPFVLLRAVFQYDMTDPEIRRMVTAAHLGARSLLYPGASRHEIQQLPDAPVTHAPSEVGQTLDGHVVEQPATEPESTERMETAGLPDDAGELAFDEPKAPASANVYHVLKGVQRGKGEAAQYFFETKEGVTLYTPDLAIAKALKAAIQDGQPREVASDRVMVAGKPYLQAIEVTAAGGLKL